MVPHHTQSPHSAMNNSRARWIAVAGATVAALILLTSAVSARASSGPPPAVRGPLVAEAYADNGPTPEPSSFDHSAWESVLKAHLDADGWVDYAGLKAESAALDRYIDQLKRADLDVLGRDEKLALLINAYNAFTLRLILDHYPLKSIMDIPEAKRWDQQRWNIGGHTWSLNEIEHEQIRKHFKEPRIHFALVCAAVGCPPLRREAYTGSALDEQLQAQTDYVHRQDRWFRFDASTRRVQLTKLYQWYGDDFRQHSGSVPAYVASHVPRLKQALDSERITISYLPYDWALNSQKNRP